MRDHWRAALFLYVVLNIAFFPLLWSKKTILQSATQPSIMPNGPLGSGPGGIPYPTTSDPGAPAWTIEAYLKLIKYQYLTEHVVPMWNPYQGFGVPLAANMQSQPFYPLTVLLSFFASPKTYNWYIILRLFLAGWTMYLFLRYYVSFFAALAGGAAAMLGGYYTLYCTMPELSVSICLPIGLLAAEYLVRKQSYIAVVLFALNTAMLLVGGMPEETVIGFSLIYPYLLYRLWQMRTEWKRPLTLVVVSTIAGVLLCSVLLLPFWEFVKLSFNLHETRNNGGIVTGYQHDIFNGSAFTYFFPLFFGPPTASIFGIAFSGLRNYFGLIALFLILVSWVALFRKRALNSLTVFFSAVAIFFLLKRYGVQPFNLIGGLPLYNLIDFYKYGESAVSICIAALVAIGCERLFSKQVAAGPQTVCLLLSLVPLIWAVTFDVQSDLIAKVDMRFSAVAIGVPLILLFLLSVVLIWTNRTEAALSPRLKLAIATLLALEFALTFTFPLLEVFNNLAGRDKNPFRGAPYIKQLQSLTAQQHERVFGREGSLYPNWASAFQISDIRDLDALYYKKYLPFVHNFADPRREYHGDMLDRFTGVNGFDFGDPPIRRLFQLTSAKYLITAALEPVPLNDNITKLFAQNNGHLPAGQETHILRNGMTIDNDSRDAFLEHPPYARLPYRLNVPNGSQEVFQFSYGLNPDVFDKGGDGVGFTIELRTPAGHIAKVFSNYINPKQNPGQRHWIDGAIDLTAYRGKPVELLFSTDPGPIGDAGFDWAYWSNFHFASESVQQRDQALKQIYSRELFIYRYDDVLPRASVYYRATTVPNEAAVLRQLASPDFDVFQSVVLTPDEKTHAAEVNAGAARRVEAATITSYKSQDVSISANLAQDGIVVLNDTDYPGWTVEVDGKPAEWFTANYIFRGVFVKAGNHTVRFRYQSKPFQTGARLSLATLFGLFGFGVFRKASTLRRQRN